MNNNYFQPIVNPNDPKGPQIQAILPYSLILEYYKFYPVRYENLRAAKFVLEHPDRIFAGVRRYTEGGWCFTGRPTSWYIRETVEVPFPDNLVFAVYLNSRFEIYECRAENSETNDRNCPKDWQNRYAGLIWKSIS